MIRQLGFAVGIAIFVALVGSPGSAEAHMAAFRFAWWVMAVITTLGLVPLLMLRRHQQIVMPTRVEADPSEARPGLCPCILYLGEAWFG